MNDLLITQRHLPHWTCEGSWYFVTFCLESGVLTIDEQQMVLDHIKDGHSRFYRLVAVSVMPDHVHIILSPLERWSLSDVMKGIKGVSAREINKRRGTHGSLWQWESWDRVLRDDREQQEKLRYMLMNPVEEGLADNPWTYPGWFLQS